VLIPRGLRCVCLLSADSVGVKSENEIFAGKVLRFECFSDSHILLYQPVSGMSIGVAGIYGHNSRPRPTALIMLK
jgi:hypothetical protein